MIFLINNNKKISSGKGGTSREFPERLGKLSFFKFSHCKVWVKIEKKRKSWKNNENPEIETIKSFVSMDTFQFFENLR
jgi:hypothetical protein